MSDSKLPRATSTSVIVAPGVDDHHVADLFRDAEYHTNHVRQNIADHPYP